MLVQARQTDSPYRFPQAENLHTSVHLPFFDRFMVAQAQPLCQRICIIFSNAGMQVGHTGSGS